MADIDGLPQLNARLKAIGDTRLFLGRLGLTAVGYAKQTVPRKTGNLGRTIRLGTVTADSAQIIAGGNLGVGYAQVVELGSRPHDIRPRRKKVLLFSSNPQAVRLTGSVRVTHRGLSGSENAALGIVFSKKVRHPGTKAQPFLRPAAERAVAETGASYIIEAWNRAA